MNKRQISVPQLIAIRYVSIRSHSHLVSFMSAISIFGLSLGVGILILLFITETKNGGEGRRGLTYNFLL